MATSSSLAATDKEDGFAEWRRVSVREDHRLHLDITCCWESYMLFWGSQPHCLEFQAFERRMCEEFVRRTARKISGFGLCFPRKTSAHQTYVCTAAISKILPRRDYESLKFTMEETKQMYMEHESKSALHSRWRKCTLEVWSAQCENRPIQKGICRIASLESRRIPDDDPREGLRGQNGVFATEDIEAGEILMPYALIMCRGAEVEWMVRPEDMHNFNVYSIIISESEDIHGSGGTCSGQHYGNLASLINDCRKSLSSKKVKQSDRLRQNCTYAFPRLDGFPFPFVYATRRIPKGREVLSYYGLNYFRNLASMYSASPTFGSASFLKSPVEKKTSKTNEGEKCTAVASSASAASAPLVTTKQAALENLLQYYREVRREMSEIVERDNIEAFKALASLSVPQRDTLLALTISFPSSYAEAQHQRNVYRGHMKDIWQGDCTAVSALKRRQRWTIDPLTGTKCLLYFSSAGVVFRLVLAFRDTHRRTDIDSTTDKIYNWLKSNIGRLADPCPEQACTGFYWTMNKADWTLLKYDHETAAKSENKRSSAVVIEDLPTCCFPLSDSSSSGFSSSGSSGSSCGSISTSSVSASSVSVSSASTFSTVTSSIPTSSACTSSVSAPSFFGSSVVDSKSDSERTASPLADFPEKPKRSSSPLAILSCGTQSSELSKRKARVESLSSCSSSLLVNERSAEPKLDTLLRAAASLSSSSSTSDPQQIMDAPPTDPIFKTVWENSSTTNEERAIDPVDPVSRLGQKPRAETPLVETSKVPPKNVIDLTAEDEEDGKLSPLREPPSGSRPAHSRLVDDCKTRHLLLDPLVFGSLPPFEKTLVATGALWSISGADGKELGLQRTLALVDEQLARYSDSSLLAFRANVITILRRQQKERAEMQTLADLQRAVAMTRLNRQLMREKRALETHEEKEGMQVKSRRIAPEFTA